MNPLTESDVLLINKVQKNFPVSHDPFTQIAKDLKRDKHEIIKRLQELKEQGVISRFGGVVNHKKMGCSMLVAIKVPFSKMETTVSLINGFEEINHNYMREHNFNLWFVVTAKTNERLNSVLQEIIDKSGCQLIRLPMIKSYYIDLAFDL
ncbi:Lrp/AsnC family transcriptional regulator [Aliikangiella sp. IMCC44359]|uniref:Lrp/AsnC family transcriptional regulator n=1 Tax=Aliikangiella sp. IMCC44359 TaxID=3459125 RepID=UPI00403B0F50